MRRAARLGYSLMLSMAALGSPVPGAAQTGDYPIKPIHLVIGYAPGGNWDVVARRLAPKLSAELNNQSIIVENHVGANGILGTDYLAKAKPDGYTIGLGGLTPLVLNSLTYPKLPYNATTSFSGVSTIVSTPILFVVKPALPVKSLSDLVALAKSRPGALNFATVGAGGSTRVILELFNQTAGTTIRYVPYTAVSRGVTELLGGLDDGMAIDFPVLYNYARQGQLRPIMTTGAKRSPLLPTVPTAIEEGMPTLTVGNWFCLLAPAHTPRPIIDKLYATITKIVASSEMSRQFMNDGMEPMLSASPHAYDTFLASELTRWGKVVKDAHIEADK